MTHRTEAGERRRRLLSEARKLRGLAARAREISIAGDMPESFEELAAGAEEEARDLQKAARLEDLTLWVLEKSRELAKGGTQTYRYWYASWREGGTVKNHYLGSVRRVSREKAMEKAMAMKEKALGIRKGAADEDVPETMRY
ncbi:MAG TPA: hypothetical protein PLQ01_02185 [Methanothrix sp.]|nr:hypothetical protein [Methanothrix sp.]